MNVLETLDQQLNEKKPHRACIYTFMKLGSIIRIFSCGRVELCDVVAIGRCGVVPMCVQVRDALSRHSARLPETAVKV